MSLYSLNGIESPFSNDPWVLRQFEGFDGTPWQNVPGNGAAVLTPGVSVVPSVVPSGGSMPSLISGGGSSGPSVLPPPQPMPSATVATMPTVTGTANATMRWNGRGQRGGNTPHAITPQYLNQRLPSIVNPAPMDMGGNCQGGFGGWVADNPVMAGLGLALLVWMAWRRGE